ncbi:MAG: amidoligase family protein [Candidatus Heimdallarchaeota archaeon]
MKKGKYINKIGVELEAGYVPDLPAEKIKKLGWKITTDGSIRIKQIGNHAYEIVSPPISNIKQLYKGVRFVYRFVREVNESMGLHIHVSFKKKTYYQKVASMSFFYYFLKKLERSDLINEIPNLLYRLQSCSWASNKICPHQIDDQIIAERKMGTIRYTAINFCRTLHNTIEIRIFPAVSEPEQVFKCVNFSIRAINSYLAKQLRKQYDLIEKDVEKRKLLISLEGRLSLKNMVNNLNDNVYVEGGVINV